MYGLPRIHEDGIPFRPTVNYRGSAYHLLSWFFVEIVAPLTDKSSLYVKNSAHFIEKIGNAPIHSNQVFSLDVLNLLTKVPLDESLIVVQDKLATDLLLERRESSVAYNIAQKPSVVTMYIKKKWTH